MKSFACLFCEKGSEEWLISLNLQPKNSVSWVPGTNLHFAYTAFSGVTIQTTLY